MSDDAVTTTDGTAPASGGVELPTRQALSPIAVGLGASSSPIVVRTMSGWHHHGDNVTIGYVLKGKVTLEFGPGGRERVEVYEGEYFEVPKQLVHREGNMSTETGEIILARVGEGQVVFPVEGPDPA